MNSDQIKVSIVILNWNGSKLLQRYLPSVVKHTPLDMAEIVVADNGSTDDSLIVLKCHFPHVRIISFSENYGFAEGYNRALAMISTPYTVLLNNDCGVSSGWLTPLIDFADTHPNVGALQPKLLADHDHSRFEYAGAAGGYLDRFGYPYCRGRIFDHVERDEGQYDTPRPIMWATGACLFVRTALYNELGGLDPHFFAHMEEIDLAWRMRRKGFALYCIPQSVAYHLGGASLAMGHPRKTYLNFRNSLLMLHKNLTTPKQRRHTLSVRRWLDYVAALHFLLQGKLAHARAIFRARRDAKRMICELYPSPSPFPEESLSTHFKENDISILVAYYLKGHKLFSMIFKE